MSRYPFCISGVLLTVLSASLPCQSASITLWQIGKFNDSSLEFRQGAPSQDPTFVVGASDPAREWYAAQPCTATDGRSRPYTVRFDLPQVPSGLYTLRLSLLAHTPRSPTLELSVNGKRGRFFQHPALNYTGNDPADRFLPIFSQASIAFDVPTNLLRQGTNTLLLTAITDDPPGGLSQITYDAVALEHDSTRTASPQLLSADVQPTIFYKSNANGLVEVVDVDSCAIANRLNADASPCNWAAPVWNRISRPAPISASSGFDSKSRNSARPRPRR